MKPGIYPTEPAAAVCSGNFTPAGRPQFLLVEVFQQQFVAGMDQLRVPVNDFGHHLLHLVQDLQVGDQVDHHEIQAPALTGAFQFARASQFQVHFRDAETIGGIAHGLEPDARFFG